MKKLYLFFFLINYAVAEFNIGEIVNLCDASSAELDHCLLREANKMIPFLTKGIEEFDIPKLDPLIIPKMDFDMTRSPKVELILNDIAESGLSCLVFDSVRSNFGKGILEFNGTIPNFHIESYYKGKGKIVGLPISGEGKANFQFNNTKVFMRLQVESAPCENAYCLNIKTFDLSFIYDEFRISFPHLSKKINKRLDDAIKRFIASKRKEILNAFQTPFEQSNSKIIVSALQKFFNNVPIERLFKTL